MNEDKFAKNISSFDDFSFNRGRLNSTEIRYSCQDSPEISDSRTFPGNMTRPPSDSMNTLPIFTRPQSYPPERICQLDCDTKYLIPPPEPNRSSNGGCSAMGNSDFHFPPPFQPPSVIGTRGGGDLRDDNRQKTLAYTPHPQVNATNSHPKVNVTPSFPQGNNMPIFQRELPRLDEKPPLLKATIPPDIGKPPPLLKATIPPDMGKPPPFSSAMPPFARNPPPFVPAIPPVVEKHPAVTPYPQMPERPPFSCRILPAKAAWSSFPPTIPPDRGYPPTIPYSGAYSAVFRPTTTPPSSDGPSSFYPNYPPPQRNEPPNSATTSFENSGKLNARANSHYSTPLVLSDAKNGVARDLNNFMFRRNLEERIQDAAPEFSTTSSIHHLRDNPGPISSDSSRLSSSTSSFSHKEWMKNWACDIEDSVKNTKVKSSKPKIKISEMQRLLLDYGSSINELDTVLRRIPNCKNEEKMDLIAKSKILIDKVETSCQWFNSNEDILDEFKTQVKLRREKRLRARKKKATKTQKRRLLKARWEETSRRIDQKLAEQARLLEMKLDKEALKKEADLVLREVRQKQEQATNMSKLLAALVELRNTRLKKGDAHGFVSTSEADSFLAKFQDDFARSLDIQMTQYKAEEKTLKVMMESTSGYAAAHSSRSSSTRSVDELNRAKRRLRTALFGTDDQALTHSDNCDIRNTYTVNSMSELIQRRREWDAMIDNNEKSVEAQIPISWVPPSNSPNSEKDDH